MQLFSADDKEFSKNQKKILPLKTLKQQHQKTLRMFFFSILPTGPKQTQILCPQKMLTALHSWIVSSTF